MELIARDGHAAYDSSSIADIADIRIHMQHRTNQAVSIIICCDINYTYVRY